jgi:flagella basal body P-ring formation protein FlgA
VPAIQKGQVVKVSVERGQISISTQMTAENSAEIGQRIRLRNEESRQIVEGVVTAVGAATLP